MTKMWSKWLAKLRGPPTEVFFRFYPILNARRKYIYIYIYFCDDSLQEFLVFPYYVGFIAISSFPILSSCHFVLS